MQFFKKQPIFLLLFVIFFCLHGYAENIGAIKLIDIGKVALAITVFIIVLFFTIYFLKKNILFSALATVFIATWFFFFGALHDFVKAYSWLYLIKPYSIFLPILITFTLLWIYLLHKKIISVHKLTLFLNVLFVCYCIIDISNILLSTKIKPSGYLPLNFNNASITNKPNIFLILADGYPGQKSLRDSFQFENNLFTNFLQAQSFSIINTTANYNLTTFSMASLLNMTYVKNDYNANAVSQKIHQVRYKDINNATIFKLAKNMGYSLHNNSIFNVDNVSSTALDNNFVLGNSMLLTDKILINRLNKEVGMALPMLVQKYVPFVRDQSPLAHRNYNERAISNLQKIAEAKFDEKPKFCYTHLIMPHGPYYYDSLGNQNNYKEITAPFAWMDKTKFLAYLKYTNSLLKNILLDIKTKQPNAIIILLSDHGFREYNNDNYTFQPSHFNNFCAIYSPTNQSQYQNKTLTNVNFFRLLLNVEFNQTLPYLSDSIINVVN